MLSLFHRLEPGTPDELNIIVENPKGVMGKYEMDKETGAIRVDRVSYAPMAFPFEYGMIPGTWNKYDNDPMDAMIWSSFPTFPGAVFPARVIAMLEMEDTGEIDHKILALPHNDPRLAHIKSFDEFPDFWKKEIEYFWDNYKKLMPGKSVKIIGWKNYDETVKFLQETFAEYEKKFGDMDGCGCGSNCACGDAEEAGCACGGQCACGGHDDHGHDHPHQH